MNGLMKQYILNSDQLVFGDTTSDKNGRVQYQDVLFNDIVIGCLVHIQGSLLKEMTMFYQINAPDHLIELFDSYYPTEDEGRIFGCINFENESKFIHYVNEYSGRL